MKLVYLSPTSLLFLGKSTSDIGKALINCKRRMGSPYNIVWPPKIIIPFMTLVLTSRCGSRFSLLLQPQTQSFSSREARKFSPEEKEALIFRVPLILEMIIERFFVEEEATTTMLISAPFFSPRFSRLLGCQMLQNVLGRHGDLRLLARKQRLLLVAQTNILISPVYGITCDSCRSQLPLLCYPRFA